MAHIPPLAKTAGPILKVALPSSDFSTIAVSDFAEECWASSYLEFGGPFLIASLSNVLSAPPGGPIINVDLVSSSVCGNDSASLLLLHIFFPLCACSGGDFSK